MLWGSLAERENRKKALHPVSPLVLLDNAATTRIDPRVRAAMEPFLGEAFGNPSSPHRAGVRAAEALDHARRQVARAVGAPAERIVFTSGGTEANNLAVLGLARAARGRHVLVGPTEHASVRGPVDALVAEGFDVETLPLDENGALDVEAAAALVRQDTALVALMLANNEVGSIYPVARLARTARASGALVHVDAVQALGKLELSMEELGADSLAISAHKIHGPKGAGALAMARELPLRPLVFGGGQQRGLRAGTENVAALVGLGAAAELCEKELSRDVEHMLAVRAALLEGLAMLEGVRVLQFGASQLPSIVAVELPGPPAEVWLHHLDARGIVVGAGSACNARERRVSPVLKALGLEPERARQVARFSFSRTSRPEDAQRAVAALAEIALELGAMRA